MEYTTVGLPKPFAERFHGIMSFFGYRRVRLVRPVEKRWTNPCRCNSYHVAYRTFSEFVVETVRQRLQEMETKYDLHQFEKDRKDGID